MLVIVCVQSENYCGRGKEYVEKLYDMCIRNLPDGFKGKFVCFTDDEQSYTEGIEKRPLHGSLKGWWNVPYVFKNGHFDDGDQILLFGLDTLIVGALDEIVTYQGDFAVLRDVYYPDKLQNSVTMWKANTAGDIWDLFESLGFPNDLPRGEQQLIEMAFEKRGTKPDILNDLFPKMILSHKEEAKYSIPRGTRVIYFHGRPKPHEFTDGYVNALWKIGAGWVPSWTVVGNVDESVLEANVRSSLDLPLEILANQYMAPTDQKLLICGGGPSLEDNLIQIERMSLSGAIVWCLNNSFRYLAIRGVSIQAHLMMDAREENADFIPEYTDSLMLYSAQCHPKVFEKGMKAGKVMVWCPAIPAIYDILREKGKLAAIVGGGSSIGMKALGLAQLFGFKDIHLFGYDSSYRDDKNHAYAQPLNDAERVIDIDVHDKKFKCAPWMATQADEFQQSAPALVSNGIQLTVHGDGLLPYLASLM